jgi:hypothetical protein
VSKRNKTLDHYLCLLDQRDSNGNPLIIVGGQAVNFWANKYHESEKELRKFRPYTSDDIDFYGLKEEAIGVAKALGVKITVPRKGSASPVSGSFEIVGPTGSKIPVHFLHNLCGLKNELVTTSAIEGLWKNRLIRVTSPVVSLQGKIACLHQLSQKDRQDEKHVRMLIPCVRGFLRDSCIGIEESDNAAAKALLQIFEKIADMVTDTAGVSIVKKYEIDFSSIFPVVEIRQVKNNKIRKFYSTRFPQILKRITPKITPG